MVLGYVCRERDTPLLVISNTLVGAMRVAYTLKTKPDGTPELAKANVADNAGSISVSLSYGTSKSSSQQTSQSDTAMGSSVIAGDTTTIKATGDGQNSNLTVQGSDVSSKAVNLEADNQVNLLSDGYERQSGITTKAYFEGLELHRKRIRSCMDGKKYFWIEQCDARCIHP